MNDVQFLTPAASNFLSQNSGGVSSFPSRNFGDIFDHTFAPVQSLSIGAGGGKLQNGFLPAQNNQPAKRGGIGGLFDRIEEATQSPLFGLGIGLLSGSPQQGFSNARSLSRDQADAKSGSRRRLKTSEIREALLELGFPREIVSQISEAALSSAFNR